MKISIKLICVALMHYSSQLLFSIILNAILYKHLGQSQYDFVRKRLNKKNKKNQSSRNNIYAVFC